MKTKDIIIDYYKDTKLDVLDKDSKGVYGAFPTYHYAAVSLNYLYEHLFKKKITKKFIARKIFELCQENYLLPIPCNFANDLVFCRKDYADKSVFSKFTIDENGVVCSRWCFDLFSNKVSYFNGFLKKL